MPPVLVVRSDALVARRGSAPANTQVGDECAVRERAEPGSDVSLGERTSRLSLPLSESLKGFRIVLLRSVVLDTDRATDWAQSWPLSRRTVYPSGSGVCRARS